MSGARGWRLAVCDLRMVRKACQHAGVALSLGNKPFAEEEGDPFLLPAPLGEQAPGLARLLSPMGTCGTIPFPRSCLKELVSRMAGFKGFTHGWCLGCG